MKEDTSSDSPETKGSWSDQLPIRFKKKFWNSEKIISLSAFVVSIATLLALMYQIRIAGEENELVRQQQELMRKQQYASVLPYLFFRTNTNTGNRLFELTLSNNGVGPAFIEEIRIVYEGQIYPGSPFQFYKTVIIPMYPDMVYLGTENINRGNLVPAREEVAMLIANSYSASPEDRDELINLFARRSMEEPSLAQVEIIYSSVYGERWIIEGIGAIPEPLPSPEAE